MYTTWNKKEYDFNFKFHHILMLQFGDAPYPG
jgi:hypothetical protein